MAEERKKSYLWVSVFFVGWRLKLLKVKKRFLCKIFLFGKRKCAGKKAKNLFVCEGFFFWVSIRNIKSKKKKRFLA